MTTITSGVFSSKYKAEPAINELKARGISDSDISCVYTNYEGDMKNNQTGEKVGNGAATGATTGAVIGTIAGLVVANGLLPGLGTLFVAGPLAGVLGFTGVAATTVAGAATGAVTGGLIGALMNLGISKEDAEIYERRVSQGGALVIYKADDVSVVDVFKSHNATEIRQHNQT